MQLHSQFKPGEALMPKKAKLKFDTIGYWSEIKLDIIKDYASGIFTNIINKKIKACLYRCFCRCWAASFKETGGFIPGSPSIALNV